MKHFWTCVECDERNPYPQCRICDTCGTEISAQEEERVRFEIKLSAADEQLRTLSEQTAGEIISFLRAYASQISSERLDELMRLIADEQAKRAGSAGEEPGKETKQPAFEAPRKLPVVADPLPDNIKNVQIINENCIAVTLKNDMKFFWNKKTAARFGAVVLV